MVRAAVVAGFVLALAASCLAQEYQHGKSQKVGDGALSHIVQRSGAEGIQSGGCAAAFLPV